VPRPHDTLPAAAARHVATAAPRRPLHQPPPAAANRTRLPLPPPAANPIAAARGALRPWHPLPPAAREPAADPMRWTMNAPRRSLHQPPPAARAPAADTRLMPRPWSTVAAAAPAHPSRTLPPRPLATAAATPAAATRPALRASAAGWPLRPLPPAPGALAARPPTAAPRRALHQPPPLATRRERPPPLVPHGIDVDTKGRGSQAYIRARPRQGTAAPGGHVAARGHNPQQQAPPWRGAISGQKESGVPGRKLRPAKGTR
jgi:hypothetical protein